jgi:hypothetical protein
MIELRRACFKKISLKLFNANISSYVSALSMYSMETSLAIVSMWWMSRAFRTFSVVLSFQ